MKKITKPQRNNTRPNYSFQFFFSIETNYFLKDKQIQYFMLTPEFHGSLLNFQCLDKIKIF